ncbi:MAG TPA: cytochrome c biogenesis heme-transporting ATPase CcmA [Burkholderiales bacterium]|nr:cytochrome c biogenesis heme-transporting ATPase CcmA [Burkholderiales bacterium]
MLEAVDLECARGGRILFRALSLALKPGDVVRIAGENGRGKTSLLRILCGLLAPTAGDVRWDGTRIATLREEYSRRLVYLGHAPAVKDELTAEENLAIACRLAGLPGADAASALEQFGVPKARAVGRMSQGQRRRAALARLVLSAGVPLWLLDEPLAALDVDAAALVESLVAAHATRGGMVVFTTHQEARLVPTRTVSLDA